MHIICIIIPGFPCRRPNVEKLAFRCCCALIKIRKPCLKFTCALAFVYTTQLHISPIFGFSCRCFWSTADDDDTADDSGNDRQRQAIARHVNVNVIGIDVDAAQLHLYYFVHIFAYSVGLNATVHTKTCAPRTVEEFSEKKTLAIRRWRVETTRRWSKYFIQFSHVDDTDACIAFTLERVYVRV